MSRTYSSLHYHVVFGTKNRERLIAKGWQSRLHEYLGGVIAGKDGFPQGIGGVDDHVHLLIGLRPVHCLADVVRELKKATNAWIHDEIGIKRFAWQEGYAAFTVSATARSSVKKYITNQAVHHAQVSYHDEMIGMLKRADIDYDEAYVC
jgi:REP element-mobilizing transposase RayT